MLGKSEEYDEPRIYALDRIKALEQAERTFKLPKSSMLRSFCRLLRDYHWRGGCSSKSNVADTCVRSTSLRRIRQHKVVVFPLCPEMAGKNFTFTQNSTL